MCSSDRQKAMSLKGELFEKEGLVPKLDEMKQKITEEDYEKEMNLASEAEEKEEFEEAENHYRKALRYKPEEKSATEAVQKIPEKIMDREYRKCVEKAKLWDFEEAISWYENALRYKPEDIQASLAIADWKEKIRHRDYQKAMQEGQRLVGRKEKESYESAVLSYEKAQSLFPEDKAAIEGSRKCREILKTIARLEGEASERFQAKDYGVAFEKAKEGIEMVPSSGIFKYFQSECRGLGDREIKELDQVDYLYRSGNLAQAWRMCESLRRDFPHSEKVRELAEKISERKRLRRRVRLTLSALFVLVILGVIGFWKFQQWQEYRKRKHAFLEPYGRAENLRKQGKWEEAMAEYQKAKAAQFEEKPKEWDSPIAHVGYMATLESLKMLISRKNWPLARKTFWAAWKEKGETPELVECRQSIPKVAYKYGFSKKIIAGIPAKFAIRAEEKLEEVIWDFGDGEKAEGAEVTHVYKKEVKVTVKFLAWDGTERNRECTVEENREPIVDWEVPVECKLKNTVVFQAQARDPEGQKLQYRWYFGDGNSQEGARVEHNYQSSGEKEIELKVDDGFHVVNKKGKVKIIGRYRVSSEGVIHDPQTGLDWFVGPDKDTTWYEAKKFADNLTVSGGGWRLPSVEELRGIYEKGKGSRNMDPLFKTSGWWVWADDGGESSSSSAPNFSFRAGLDYRDTRGDSLYFRGFAVRRGRQ